MFFLKVSLSLLLFSTSIDLSRAQNGSSMPIAWHFNDTNLLGPDGPWTAIDIQVGWPAENMSVFPGRSQATLVISKAVCERQGSNCSNPGLGFYDKNPVKNLTANELNIQSDTIQGWDGNLTDPLGLSGSVTRTLERVTVSLEDGGIQYLDNLTFLVSDGLTANFAGGPQISLDVGVLSLASEQAYETNITTSWRGTTTLMYTPLAWLSTHGETDDHGETDAPISASWGLHVGSARYNVSGSLYFGGYDEARVLDAPGIFNSTAILLTNVSINSTIAAFQSTGNLLGPSNTPSSDYDTSVVPEPALPYLYLPPAVCASLAVHLPINFNSDLQLYTWDLGHPSLQTLLSSLSSLRFTFTNSSNTITTIIIPLALLNLTLTPPLVKTPTPYFPCRPYTPKLSGGAAIGSGEYYLGRAFLQGAFIGQNWDTGSYFLAQAPGPSLPSSRVAIIGPNDTAISATTDARAWEDTWKDVLSKDGIGQANTSSSSSSSQNSSFPTSASAATTSSPRSGSSPRSDSGPRPGPSLSRKARLGIGIVCAIVGLAAVFTAGAWVRSMRSRRRNGQESGQQNPWAGWKKPEWSTDTHVVGGEMEGTGHVHEVETNNRVEIGGVESRHVAAQPWDLSHPWAVK